MITYQSANKVIICKSHLRSFFRPRNSLIKSKFFTLALVQRINNTETISQKKQKKKKETKPFNDESFPILVCFVQKLDRQKHISFTA